MKVTNINPLKENISSRTYRTSINIFFFSFYSNSKVYEIPRGKSLILPGIKYSLMTILFGWWGFGYPWNIVRDIKNSITALHINFSGGDDYTRALSEMEYEEKTVWVFNNLNRILFEKITIDTIDIINDLQNVFIISESNKTLEKNIMFLNENLKKINIINLKNSDLEEIINLIQKFEFIN